MAKRKRKTVEGMDISLNCPKCGQPLTHANEYGTFCDNECELAEAKEIASFAMPWINAMGKLMEQEMPKPESERMDPMSMMAAIAKTPEHKQLTEYLMEREQPDPVCVCGRTSEGICPRCGQNMR